MQDELKACPFCGDRGPEITGDFTNGLKIYIACTAGSDCTATGPACDTEAEAITAWNTRADPALAAAQDKTDWFAGDVDADGNPLTTLRTDELDKYKDQVRYTCQRAEKAEAALAAALAEVERYREALAPFAKFYDALEHMGRQTPKTGEWYVVESSVTGRRAITIEDFLAARAALEPRS